jgi:hypothetical protein
MTTKDECLHVSARVRLPNRTEGAVRHVRDDGFVRVETPAYSVIVPADELKLEKTK